MEKDWIEDDDCPELGYYLNEELSDVWFVVDGEKLPANKTFLSVKSVVFRAQFSGNFVDSDQKEIMITDATTDGFKAMLRFLHSESLALIDDKSVDLALDVYCLSHKYQLNRLKIFLECHLDKLINKDNFADIYAFAFERQFTDLMAIVKIFMKNNINDWVNRKFDDILELNNKTRNSLLEIIVDKYRETSDLWLSQW